MSLARTLVFQAETPRARARLAGLERRGGATSLSFTTLN